jgi:predicted glycoside hydrolase/deacetylase ChbG (UPF0249 family)
MIAEAAAPDTVLIVNADDFGLSSGVNRGVIRAHESGIVTSATLMVRAPAAAAAAAAARARPALSVGLHLDLGEWEYREHQWHARYEVVPTDDESAVRDEIDRQLMVFVQLMDRPPTHLDSHQHVHRALPVRRLLEQAGARLGVPVRDVTPGIAYNGAFYGQDGKGRPLADAITVEGLLRVIASLPAGITEIGCHPGEDSDLDSAYGSERAREVATLCHPRVRDALDANGVALRSFADIHLRGGKGSG